MPRPGQILLSSAIAEYLDLRRGRYSEATIYNDTYVLRRFVREIGDVQVMNVRPEKVDAWFASLLRPHTTGDGRRRDPVKPRSYNNIRARVQQFSKYCQARGLTRAEWLVYTPRIKEPRTIAQRVDNDTLWQMLEALDDEPRDRALLALAINTAVRTSEAKALKVGDVDLKARRLRIWVSKSQVEDIMVMSDHLREELARWLAHYRRDVLAYQGRLLTEGDPLFPAKQGPRITGRYRDEDGVLRNTMSSKGYNTRRPVPKPQQTVQRALAAVGLPTQHQGLHTIRRSVARLVFDTLTEDENYEAALRTVSALLHHASSSTTETYLGLSTETRKRDQHLRTRGVLGARPGTQGGKVIPLR